MARRSKVVQTEDAPPSYNPATEIVTDLAESAALPESTAEQEQPRQRQPIQDPRSQASYALTEAGHAGPQVHLWRSNRKGVMAVTFDEKPEQQYTQKLKEAGFRWEPQEKAWEIRMDPEAKWKAVVTAQRAVVEVANAIRQDRGLEPVSGLGVA